MEEKYGAMGECDQITILYYRHLMTSLSVGICYTICNVCTADIKIITITARLNYATVKQW